MFVQLIGEFRFSPSLMPLAQLLSLTTLYILFKDFFQFPNSSIIIYVICVTWYFLLLFLLNVFVYSTPSPSAFASPPSRLTFLHNFCFGIFFSFTQQFSIYLVLYENSSYFSFKLYYGNPCVLKCCCGKIKRQNMRELLRYILSIRGQKLK